jgi:DNA modification methylase
MAAMRLTHGNFGVIKLRMQIERIGVDALIPYARNSRTHSDAQVAQIAASIREFGFTNPVLIDADNSIIAGHGRVLAARKLRMQDVPAIRLAHLTKAQKRAYVIADNKLALNAGWDIELLRLEINDLRGLEFDVALTGFSTEELDALMAPPGTEGLTDPDAIPEAPEHPIAVAGDVWLLGRHRLVCGDCTDPLAVEKALGGVKPHLMVTDPPYGVEYDPTWRAKAGINKSKGKLGKVLNDDKADWREAWSLFPGDVFYIWSAPGPLQCVVHDSLVSVDMDVRQQIIWAKDRFALGRGHYHYQHEICWYGVRKDKTAHYNGDRSQSTLWSIKAREDGGVGHGTQKPVECMKRPIENNSSPGQAVYEPFSGSGTTIIAAEMTGRACHAIELNAAYVDVAIKRWQEFTGQIATLEGDGRSFSDMATERCKAAA